MGILDGLFGSSNQTITQKPPQWYSNAAQQVIQQGANAGSWYAMPYMGNQVAPLTQSQLQNIAALQANVGSSNAGYNAAAQGMQNAMNYNPQMVGSNYQPQNVYAGQQAYNYNPQNVQLQQAAYGYKPQNVQAGQTAYNYKPGQVNGGSFLSGNVQKYMDPYIQNVEKQALGRLDDARKSALNQNADTAISAGAFGGSRHGVVEATTNAEAAKSAGELSANLRSQAYNNAANLMEQDFGRGLQAQMANQQAGMQNAQFGANVGLQNNQLGLNASLANQQAGMNNAQFGANLGYQYNMGGLQAQQFNAQQGLNNAQFGANLGMQNIQNNLQAQQFNSQMGYNAAQMNQQAQMANQQAGLQANQQQMQAAQGLGQLTGDQQNAYLQGINGALMGGNMQQQYNQQLLNQAANQYNAMQQYPVNLYNMQLSALSGMQLPTSTSYAGGGGLASGIMGGLGGALTGAGLFGTGGALAGMGGLTGGGGAALGGVLGLLGGLSDEREKTNIEPLGIDPETGLPIYAYDYKADVAAAKRGERPMTMKRVGPMAQDMEAAYPGSTHEVGGKQVVANLGFGGDEAQYHPKMEYNGLSDWWNNSGRDARWAGDEAALLQSGHDMRDNMKKNWPREIREFPGWNPKRHRQSYTSLQDWWDNSGNDVALSGAEEDQIYSGWEMRDNMKKNWPREIRANPGSKIKKFKHPVGKGGQ